MTDKHPAQDARQELRLDCAETVYLELNSPLEGDDSENSFMIGRCVDISANGLQVIANVALPIGSIHQTCVQLQHPPCRLQLVTEVRWCQEHGDNGDLLLGLSIFESQDTDVQRWKELVAQRCID